MSSAAQYFLILERMLCSEILLRKCWVCSLGGHLEGVAISAMAGQSREYHCNMFEFVFKL